MAYSMKAPIASADEYRLAGQEIESLMWQQARWTLQQDEHRRYRKDSHLLTSDMIMAHLSLRYLYESCLAIEDAFAPGPSEPPTPADGT